MHRNSLCYIFCPEKLETAIIKFMDGAGGGGGLGREISFAFAGEGANVLVVDPGVTRGGEGFDRAPADKVVAEIKKRGGTAIADYGSVTDFKAANINGQVLHITRGKVAIYSEPIEVRTIYKTDADGMWTVDDLEKHVSGSLLVGYINPAPAQPPEEQK